MTETELNQKITVVVDRYWRATGEKPPVDCLLLNYEDFGVLVSESGRIPDKNMSVKWRVYKMGFDLRPSDDVPVGAVGFIWQ